MKQSIKRLLVSCVLLLSAPATLAATLLGPVGGTGLSGEYSRASDSPFSGLDFSGGYFYLDDFEGLDHGAGQQFNVIGVSGNNGGPVTQTFGPSSHDSVDLDDGVLDGSGLDGESWFYASGSVGVTFTFDAGILGALPTHAGIVWTDGTNPMNFEAFDALGASLGIVTGAHATPGFGGQTSSDRFYGAIEAGGISAIRMHSGGGGIELDHLQFGHLVATVPEPAGLLVLAIGMLMMGRKLTERRRSA